MKIRHILPLILCLAATAAYPQQDAKQSPASTQQQAAPKTYFVRLIPPRSTFLQDMTEAEGKLMKEHFTYWTDQFAKGVLLFGGPVLDPKAPYGVLVVKAANLDDATAIAAGDPTVKGGVNRIEVAEIRVAFFAKSQ
jgi:uncharacterized protein